MYILIIKRFHEEIFNHLQNLKTAKGKDQVNINKSQKIIRCLRYEVYNSIINIEFRIKIEVIKQYRQFVMTSEFIDFFLSVIQNFSGIKCNNNGYSI